MTYGKFIEVIGSDAEPLQFLAKAIYYGDSYVRAALQYIFIDDGEHEGDLLGVASDGHRLHLIPLSAELVERFGLHKGYWRVLKNKEKKQIIWLINIDEPEHGRTFPDFKKVIPSDEANYKTTFEGYHKLHNRDIKYNIKLAKLLHDFPDVTALNPYYLYELGKGTWEVFWNEQTKAIKFVNGERVCVIMPYQIDLDE